MHTKQFRWWRGGLALAATLALGSPAMAADRLAASDGSPQLLVFDSDNPGRAVVVPVTGLQSGETILGLDTRPLDGQLYLLGSTSRIYTVNEVSGAATQVGPGPFTPIINGRAIGFDVNPAADRLRVVTDVDQSLRLIPAGLTGEGTVAAVDTSLAYPPQDLGGFGFDPRVVAAAYDNNDNDPATGTTLYDIDVERDVLVKQTPPNDGTLVTVGPLGDDFTEVGGFDIAPNGTAYAVLQTGPRRASRLHTVNLTTGRATPLARVKGGGRLTSLAVLF
jgi:hypothetical protein